MTSHRIRTFGWPIAAVVLFVGLTAMSALAHAQPSSLRAPYKVGMKQLEYADPEDRSRRVALMLLYPAELAPGRGQRPFRMTFFSKLELYQDAPVVNDTVKRPLVMFSHGRGSNGPYYAWFGEYLASRGYIVGMMYHYKANTYDGTVEYFSNKLWQRPRDISMSITALLADEAWGPHIDPGRIGVAGHSQGGFTSLWIGGAKVNAQKYADFQRHWARNPMVPASLRQSLPVDPAPALDVHDSRVKAAFAMAPGDLPAFGMDEDGLRQLKIPAYIIVGARDTQAPPKPNAEFAARHIPQARLDVMPGAVDHEIFVNECDQEGRDTWPEACIDAPGVKRNAWHRYIGNVALRFFDKSLGPAGGP